MWVLLGLNRRRAPAATEQAVIPLGGAASAHIRLQHGAGRLEVRGGAAPDQLVSGTFGGGLDYRLRPRGDGLEVDMRMRGGPWPDWGPWNWGPGALDWSLALNGAIPLALDVETGASDTALDLSALRVTDLRLKTGASSTDVTLPAGARYMRARVESGAAALAVRVPAGVAARIRVEGALAGATVDSARFPRVGDGYQSPDYDTAANRVEIEIKAAVGSVDVR